MPKERNGPQSGERSGIIKKICKIMGGILIVSLLSMTSSFTSVLAKAENYPRPDYKDGIPKELLSIFENVGKEYGIRPELLEAISYRESRFIPDVRSGKYYGIMQVNVITHKDRLDKYGFDAEDLYDAESCIIVAADYLRELYELYGDDDALVLLYYSGSSAKKIEQYKEYGFITPYIKDVLTRSEKYNIEHKK